jgi:O-antigen ligase
LQVDLRPVTWRAVTLLVAGLGGLLVWRGYALVALAVLAVGGLLAVAFARPLIGVVIALVGVDSVVANLDLPAFAIGARLTIAHLILVATLAGAIAFRRQPLTRTGRSFAVVAGVLVGLLVVLSGRNIIEGHPASVGAATHFATTYLYLGIALVLAFELTQERLTPFIDALLVLAGVVAAISVVMAIFSPVASLVASLSPSSNVVTDEGAGPISRVRLPGLALIYALFVPALVLAALGPRAGRNRRALIALLLLLAIVVSFNRNMWVGALLALVVTAVVSPNWVRRRLLIRGAPAVGGLSLVAIACVAVIGMGDLSARAASLLDIGQVTASSSVRDRAYENSFATVTLREHPWAGIGPGTSYGAVLRTPTGGFAARPFVHNQYLELGVFFGVPAVVLLLLAVGSPLSASVWTARKSRSPVPAALASATAASMFAILVSSVVAIYINRPETLAPLAVLMGLGLALEHHTDEPHQP